MPPPAKSGDASLPDRSVLLMYDSWHQIDLAIEGLSRDEAMTSWGGASRIAWTARHLGQMVDSWLNRRFQGLPPHPLLGDAMLRTGASGEVRE